MAENKKPREQKRKSFFGYQRQKAEVFPLVCVSSFAFKMCKIRRYESRLPLSLTYLKLFVWFLFLFKNLFLV